MYIHRDNSYYYRVGGSIRRAITAAMACLYEVILKFSRRSALYYYRRRGIFINRGIDITLLVFLHWQLSGHLLYALLHCELLRRYITEGHGL